MILRALLKLAALLLVAALAWAAFKHPAVKAWLWPDQTKPRPFVFDNGSVNVAPEPSKPSSQAIRTGQMRRCQRGGDTRYTDQPCPAGFKELPVGGTITVLEGGGKSPAAASAPTASARKTLHDVLDLNGREDLMQKRVERSVEQASR